MGFIHKFFVTIVLRCKIFQRDIDHYYEIFKNGEGKEIVADLRKKEFKHKYIKNIRLITDFFNHFFKKNFSFAAFKNHLKLSYIYSLAFFLIGYLLYNEYAIQDLDIMPSDDSWANRFLYTGVVGFSTIIAFLYYGSANWVNDKITKLLGKQGIRIQGIAKIILGVLVLIILGALAKAVEGMVVVGVALAAAVVGGLAVVLVLLLVVVGGGAALAAAVVALGGEVGVGKLYVFILYLTLFPWVNAFMDWLSTGITRCLLEKLKNDIEHNKIIKIIGHALLDVILALVTLIILPAVLFGTFYLIERYFFVAETSLWDTEAMFSSWWEDPMRNHLWITLMLLSTLIPTLIHFAIVLISILEKVGLGTPTDDVIKNIGKDDLQAAKDYVAYKHMYFLTFLFIALVIAYFIIPEFIKPIIELIKALYS